MSLLAVFRSIPTTVHHHESTFDRTRSTHPALVPYPTTAALLAALSLGSPLPISERQELVRVLVALHRTTTHPLWPALLLHTFRPMLLSLRARDRGSKEDRDQRVLLAFLDALAHTPLAGQPAFLALRRATARSVFQTVRAQRVHDETVPLDAEVDPSGTHHADPAPFVACLAREMAAGLVGRNGRASVASGIAGAAQGA